MDFVQIIAIYLFIKVFQVIYVRRCALKAVRDCESVVYLSQHGVINDDIVQTFMQHAGSSVDVIEAHRGDKGPLTEAERARYENQRVYLLTQWRLLYDEIQSTYQKDQTVLEVMRPRDQVVVAENHENWSQLLQNAVDTCGHLRDISLITDDAVPAPAH